MSTSNPTREEIILAAEAERHDLLAQATRNHLSNIESELRRYREDTAHIESVYQLRIAPPEVPAHSPHPMSGNLRTKNGRLITAGAQPGEYPLRGTCETCGEPVITLGGGADWAHEADFSATLRRQITAHLMGPSGGPASPRMTSTQLANRARHHPGTVQAELDRMKAAGLACDETSEWDPPGTIRWYLTMKGA